MLYRIIFIGKTDYKTIKEASRRLNATARMGMIGLFNPDDTVTVDVDSLDEGKTFMRELYALTGIRPRRYAYADAYDQNHSPIWNAVWDSKGDYEKQPEHVEDFDVLLNLAK